MEKKPQLTERSQRIRQVMQTHVALRLAKALDKWKGKADTAARTGMADAREKYQLVRILEKGARANAMAVATHIAKGIHPDLRIKGVTNMAIRFDSLAPLDALGSHVLSLRRGLADTTGDGAYNAAAYELYLLLDCEIEGSTLGELLQSDDPDALNALSSDAADTGKLAADVLLLLQSKCVKPSVHALNKQIYWLVGSDPAADSDYQMLAPLYPASLVHQAHVQIHPTRYGEENSVARKARREGKADGGVYQEYRDWAVQKMGGTKPQNISHLNSERRGENYLLSSLPPGIWKTSQRYLPVHAGSVFERAFGARPAVRATVKALLVLLDSNPEPNRQTRQRVDDFLDTLMNALVIYAGEMQSQPSGWSIDARYDELVFSEKLWLDPWRAEIPEEAAFAEAWLAMDWPAEIGKRFARWLNAELQGKLPVGDVEMREWRKVLLAEDGSWAQALRSLRDQLGAPNGIPFRRNHDELVVQRGTA